MKTMALTNCCVCVVCVACQYVWRCVFVLWPCKCVLYEAVVCEDYGVDQLFVFVLCVACQYVWRCVFFHGLVSVCYMKTTSVSSSVFLCAL